MSHDIRTPMNAIMGMAAIAATHLDDRERVTAVSYTHLQGSILNIVQRFFSTGGQSNVMNYSNPELDAMMDEATRSKNLDEMAERYAEIQQVLADEVPAIPLIEQYLWCIGTKGFYGIDLNNQYYYVDFTNCVVVEE